MHFDRRLNCSLERLEPRLTLAASAVGGPALVNPPSVGDQVVSAGADAIALLESGVTVSIYEGRGVGDRDGVFLRRIDAQGSASGAAFLVNQTVAGDQLHAVVAAMPTGGFVVAWEGRGVGDREGVFARWYDASGSATTGEVRINQTAGGRQTHPHIAIASGGTATFVWHGVGAGDFDGVFARRFSAAGAALGNELLVNTTTAREQAFADIALADDGTALVTWSSRHQDGSDWGVYAQRLAADGTKSGGEFRVSTATAGSQTGASVAALDAGFAVAWQSQSQDGDGWGVYAQRLDATGAATGAELRLNESTAGNQLEIAIAATGGSGLLAAWSDGQPDGTGWNVTAREFDLGASTPALGDEFSVHPATATSEFGHQRAPSVAASGSQAVIGWSGDGAVDHDGAYLQRYTLTTDGGPNLAPNLAPIAAQTAQLGVPFSVTVTATDPNPGDTLTYLLDVDDSPTGATIEKITNGQAIIRWTPQAGDLPGPVRFRVLLSDDGNPELFDAEEFFVTLTPAS
jgi:hypothetical protein